MKRLIALCALLMLPVSATAQDDPRNAYFEDYTALRAFIDEQMADGDLTQIYERLSPEPVAAGEVSRAQSNFDAQYEAEFDASGYLVNSATSDGFREDVLVYWNADDDYIYMFLATHQRDENLIVLRWQIETSHAAIMDNF